MKGKLYIVSTPIGNLEDITTRAAKILSYVDIIACEDTRVTRKLLSHMGIKKTLLSYHEHNEVEKSEEIINYLINGNSVAVVTDAGTPCISDPGYRLVKQASENGIDVISIPGPCAATSALSISGLPTSGFTFIGFLPRTANKQKYVLEELKTYPQSLIFYESPQRVIKTLGIIVEVLGDRQCSVSRELTKIYEETIRGTLSKVIKKLEEKDKIKGEFTIVVEGFDNSSGNPDIDIESELTELKQKGKTLKEAVSIMTDRFNLQKNEVYKTALTIWD
ncbi:MAG: 16S rRNA (cytidine(1402)-2'-O)-methyltransferase [Candidatus Dadabacteria bacterium]|nr:16S rRNA (cytidine(1402)-2'-O)-methyltransferase [Candidatus Dadabacteria bacterium]NIV43199.1 16S rRNA (cytidine(1402)-2'-O)-methyltransferase [Candidatus Dadabacteria bacterium]NIX16087.1 16S rRNA (cytidine(1402)-2'-O)-methyltransferase [Candidatus Dadabacteria bacterium]